MKRVLLVDDDTNIVDGLKRAFREEEFEVSSATSAEQALELIETIPIHVLVTDERMSGMSGNELLRRVRQSYPTVIGIMLTGNAQLDVALNAINQGDIYRLFTKPCNHQELATAIKEAFEQRGLIAESRKRVDHLRVEKNYLESLEHESPGISNVRKTSEGTIIMEEPLSIDDALNAAIRELDEKES
jgi:two-component system probable response regulator PhcQ